jgi:prefoldin alpha subunit
MGMQYIHIRSQKPRDHIQKEGTMADTTEQIDTREIETLQYYLKEYGQQAEIFAGQLELMENGRMEAIAAIEALGELKTSEDGTVLLQVGAGASVRAKVLEPEKVLLNIGAEVIVERSNADAVEYLKDRITEMEASEKKVAETLNRLRNQMNEIAKRLEQGYQQAVAAEQAQQPLGLRQN